MFETMTTAELIRKKTYTMTAIDAERMRENVVQARNSIKHLEGPDGPKTPSGRIPAATQREIEGYKQGIEAMEKALKSAPPRPISFCKAMHKLTRPMVKMIKSFKQHKAKFQERFEQDPTSALEWLTGDMVAHQEAMRYAYAVCEFANNAIKEHSPVEALEAVQMHIARMRDEALKNAINNITYGQSSSPSHNVSSTYKQHGRIMFVNESAWPLSESQDAIDAYKAYVELTYS